jgi:hypothetical protein
VKYELTLHIEAEDDEAADLLVDVIWSAVRRVQNATLSGSDRVHKKDTP